jgi:hypothetical protein
MRVEKKHVNDLTRAAGGSPPVAPSHFRSPRPDAAALREGREAHGIVEAWPPLPNPPRAFDGAVVFTHATPEYEERNAPRKAFGFSVEDLELS